MRSSHAQAQRTSPRLTKIRIILILLRRVVSEIKLKRTDTTLDLSQKLLKEMRLAKCSKRFGSWRGRGGETNAKRAEEILGEDQAGKSIVIYLWQMVRAVTLEIFGLSARALFGLVREIKWGSGSKLSLASGYIRLGNASPGRHG